MHTPPIWPEPPRVFRTFTTFAADIDLKDAVTSGGVDMADCPDHTPPGRLFILNTAQTPQDIVLRDCNGTAFTVTVPARENVAGDAGVGYLLSFDGEVSGIESTGTEAGITSVVACWWTGGRMTRRPSTV